MKKDLLVLVAGRNEQAVLNAVLKRYQSLRIQKIGIRFAINY